MLQLIRRVLGQGTLLLTFAAFVAHSGAAFAQDPDPPARSPAATTPPASAPAAQAPPVKTLQLSTRIVVLDVVVTDKAGNLVKDRTLTRDDFTIDEDRVPQTIRSFEAPSAHVQPAGVVVSSSADLKKIGDAPVTLLVLDELNTLFPDMAFQRQSMVKFLKSQPAVLPQPTVLLVANNTRFVQLHDWTQDRDTLIAAVNGHHPDLPYKAQQGRSGAAGVERMAQSLASLEQIAQASAGTPGRKNLIWVGNGFPSADTVSLDPQEAGTIIAAVQQCTNMLLAARITMYTINPTANTTSTVQVTTPDDLDNAETEGGADPFGSGGVQFSTFAPATGGRVFVSRNDLDHEIAEGIAAGANYYTMSYAPTNRTDGDQKYRNIHIVMKDKNLRATTRNGYYPPTAASRNIALAEPAKQARAQLTLDISSAVNSQLSYNGLDVRAVHNGGEYTIAVKASGLDWRNMAGVDRAEVTIIAAWYDAKNKLLGHAGKETTADQPAADGSGHEGDVSFSLPLPALPGGATRLRLVVRDASSGKMGTVDLKP